MKHTPGPWKVIDHDEEYISVTDEEQQFGICRIDENASESRSSMKANARLIAAAPEMYELLKKFAYGPASEITRVMLEAEDILKRVDGES